MSAGKIVVILSGFPRRSETFALNEILALKRRGALAGIFATKGGETSFIQPAARDLARHVQILPEGAAHDQAEYVLRQLHGSPVSGVHGYFAHAPAEVAMHVASRLKKPYGFSVHAKDARKVAPDVLAQRACGAACVVACNADVAREIGASGAQVNLIPHGVDLEHFQPAPLPAAEPLRMLAVGRLVEKKGFHVLLKAVARLRCAFSLRIVGEGPEQARLASMIAEFGMAERVTLCGAKTHEELPQEYNAAHVLVAPSLTDTAGDRDGLPNVVLEAMACGRPVVATDAGAISSAVVSGETGLLVRQGDAGSLADVLHSLAAKPEWLRTLGQKGRERVQRHYEIGSCTERFYQVLRQAYA
jgi:glycosyltransferase involved in cell wall biosynthesis